MHMGLIKKKDEKKSMDKQKVDKMEEIITKKEKENIYIVIIFFLCDS